MNINLNKSVYFDNYLKLLALIHGVEYGFVNYTVKGKLNKKYCKVEFEDINQDAYCNIFTLKNILSKTGIKIKNVNLNGKFNLINLTNINPGTYSFYSRPKITTKYVSEKNNFQVDKISKIAQIDQIINGLDKASSTKNEKIFILKNGIMKNLIIKDIPNVNVIFLKNLKIDSNKITIEYKSNDIKLILINIDAEIIMINKPDLIDCKSDKDKKTLESKYSEEIHSEEIHSEEIHSEEELTEEKNTSEEEITEEKNTSEEEITEEKNTSEEELTEELKEDKEKIKEDKEKIKEDKEKIKENEEKIKENKVTVIREYFGNKSGKCLKFEDMIIIGLIIYLAYKLMVPKRQIIKLNI